MMAPKNINDVIELPEPGCACNKIVYILLKLRGANLIELMGFEARFFGIEEKQKVPPKDGTFNKTKTIKSYFA